MKKDTSAVIDPTTTNKLSSILVTPDLFENYVRRHLQPGDFPKLALTSGEHNKIIHPTMRTTAFTLFKETKNLLEENQAAIRSARSKACYLFSLSILALLLSSISFTAFAAVSANGKGPLFPHLSPLVYLAGAVLFGIASGVVVFKSRAVYEQLEQSLADHGLAEAGDLDDGDMEVVEGQLSVIVGRINSQSRQCDADLCERLETNKLHTRDLEEGLLEDYDSASITLK